MKKYRKSKRYYYFRKQKLMGLVLVILAVLSVILMEGDATAALLIGPLGLYTMFTRKMLITDDYFYEMEAKKNVKWMDPRDL